MHVCSFELLTVPLLWTYAYVHGPTLLASWRRWMSRTPKTTTQPCPHCGAPIRVVFQREEFALTSESAQPPTTHDQNHAVGRFIARFCELYREHRHGAMFRPMPKLDVPHVRDLLAMYGADRLERMAVVLLTTDDAWIAGTDRGIRILSTKASWLDNRLRERGL